MMNKNTGLIVLVISLLVLIVGESMAIPSVRWAAEMGLFFGVFLLGLPFIKGSKLPSDDTVQQTFAAQGKELLTPVFDEVELIIAHEVLTIKHEVTRIDGIIKEAVQALDESFKTVNLLSSQHRELSSVLLNKANNRTEAADAYNYVSEHAQMIDTLGDQLEAVLNDVVRSLQFEDLSSQALAALNQNAHSLTQVAEQLKLISFQDATQTQIQLHNLLHSCRAIRLQQSIAVKRPVTQIGMHAGEVEVF
jgi:predicted nucleic acid-binding OB-fold protein